MFILNKRNIISLLLALMFAGGFLWAVLTPPSIYNFLPFELYDSRHRSDISSESAFIKEFDIGSAVIVFIISYIMARNCFKTYGLFLDRNEIKK